VVLYCAYELRDIHTFKRVEFEKGENTIQKLSLLDGEVLLGYVHIHIEPSTGMVALVHLHHGLASNYYYLPKKFFYCLRLLHLNFFFFLFPSPSSN